MVTKLELRNSIMNDKTEYEETENEALIILIAVKKGLYMALGGVKGIPLPAKYDYIVENSEIMFTYKLRLNSIKGKYKTNLEHKAYICLRKLFEKRGKALNIKSNSPLIDQDIAKMLVNMIEVDYSHNISSAILNLVYDVALTMLNNIDTGR